MAVESVSISHNEKMGVLFCNFSFDEEAILIGFVGIAGEHPLPCAIGVGEFHFELFFLRAVFVFFRLWNEKILFGFLNVLNGIDGVIFRTVPMLDGPDGGVRDIIGGFVVVETVKMSVTANVGDWFPRFILGFGF